jgi:hypothetical protein
VKQRRRRNLPTNEPSFASQQWLAYRYGLAPLISDVQAAIDYVNSKLNERLNELRSKRGVVEDVKVVVTKSDDILSSFTWKGQHKTTTAIKSASIVYYKQVMTLTTAQKLGLNPGAWTGIAWELVPYSFIVDWFVNVGSWLRALSPLAAFTVIGGCVSQVYDHTYEYEFLTKPFNDYYTVDRWMPSTYMWKSRCLTRRFGSPMPAMLAYNPSPWNVKRLLDSLALSWGFISKRVKSLA